METRKVNVMGKEMQIPKGMTFGELAKEFEGEVFGKILVAKQGNSLRELICPIRTDEDITFLDFRDKEGVRVYERGISLLLVKAVRDVLGTDTGVEIEHSCGAIFIASCAAYSRCRMQTCLPRLRRA